MFMSEQDAGIQSDRVTLKCDLNCRCVCMSDFSNERTPALMIPIWLIFMLIGVNSVLAQSELGITSDASMVGRATPAHRTKYCQLNPMEILSASAIECRKYMSYQFELHIKYFDGRDDGNEQIIRAIYDENPRSIDLNWLKNPRRVRRVHWSQGRFRDHTGQELVLVEPASSVARFFTSEVKVGIHSQQAREASEYAVDEIGLRQTIDRLLDENNRLERTGNVRWDQGRDVCVNGRPTIVLIREWRGHDSIQESAESRLEIGIDREHLLPITVTRYADALGNQRVSLFTISSFRTADLSVCLTNGKCESIGG